MKRAREDLGAARKASRQRWRAQAGSERGRLPPGARAARHTSGLAWIATTAQRPQRKAVACKSEELQGFSPLLCAKHFQQASERAPRLEEPGGSHAGGTTMGEQAAARESCSPVAMQRKPPGLQPAADRERPRSCAALRCARAGGVGQGMPAVQ